MLFSESSKAFPALVALFVPLLLSTQPNFVSASPSDPHRRATACNGSPDLCNRSFGNITFVGAHDSYAVGVNNLAANQDYNISRQLDDGIRMLQMQTHNLSGTIELCHTSCALYDGGSLYTYLETVKTWLEANPNEVLSLLIVNSDDISPAAYDLVFKEVGLDTMSYAPPSASISATEWPTLNSLISSGKRLVTFMDASADYGTVPYILEEFTNIWESAYDVTTTFDCSVNRTQGDPSTEMYLINHFLDTVVFGEPVPDPSQANQTNAVSGPNSLGQQVSLCASLYNRYPNFMLVDFYEYGGGSVFEVAAAANGVPYAPSTPIATPIPQGGSSSSTSSSSSSSGAVIISMQWTTVSALVGSVAFGALCAL